MPMTPAEKQRKYREKLKISNPGKYEEMKKKSSENALKYYRNKKNNYTPEQKEEQRRKWQEVREKSKAQMSSTSQENSAVEEAVKFRNIQRRIEYKLKLENLELRNKVTNLSKCFKSLEKKFNRQQKKINKMNENFENLMIRLKTFEDSIKPDVTEETIERRRDISEYTPRKKVDEFVSEHFSNIETPKKEVIKQKLLEYNVLTETLRQEMQKSNNTEKNTLKKILNNDLVKKYKQKSKLTISLGLKSNLKQKSRLHIRKSIQLRNKIEEFYNRDDVTRATAGKKEYRTYKKVSRQIRYQLDKLKILHQKFITEVEQISFSTFKKYRPFYVLPPKIKDCDTCACVKHSNMQFLVDELKSQGLLQQDSINDVTSNFVCDFKSKECMYGECGICADRKLDDNGKVQTEKVKWFEWAMKDHEYGKGDKAKKIKRMMKMTKEGTLQDLLNTFNEEMKKFKIHVFNFYHQYNKYKECRNNIGNHEAIIHIDFSENFTCKYHKEVQATHFIKDQITLHTGVLYLKNEKPLCFCSISPNNEHCPEAIWAHLDPIIKYIKSAYPNVSILHFFSDGPTTQYRQKKNFYLFSKNIYEYGFENATWSFFESAHGKGAADGIGGAIKRKLDTKIAQGIDVPDAQTAFNVLNASDTDIKLFFIPTEDIKSLDMNLIPISGTMKIHQLMTDGILKVKYRNLSCFCNDLNGMCGCYSPMNHEFKSVQETGKRQTNKSKKRKTSEKENDVKTKNTRKSRKVSTSSEDDSMGIEYANSDVTCYMEEDTTLDILDMELDGNKDIPEVPEQANYFKLDEKTGTLINCNKKINVLSNKILKKRENSKKSNDEENYIKKVAIKHDNKSKEDIATAKMDGIKTKEGESKIKSVQEKGKTQTNKVKKRKTTEKENDKYYVKTKKTRKSRKISTSSEDDSMGIEYADSDVTCYMEEDTTLDILDMELDGNKDIPEVPEQATYFELDEKTGTLINCNKKINILSNKILNETENSKKSEESYIKKDKILHNNKSKTDIAIAKMVEIKAKESENKVSVDRYKTEDRNKYKGDQNKTEKNKNQVETHGNRAEEDEISFIESINQSREGCKKAKADINKAKEDSNKTENDENNVNEYINRAEEYTNTAEDNKIEADEDYNKAKDEISKAEISGTKAKEDEKSIQKSQYESLNTENLVCSALKINDTVLVRYYQKKTWKYYVGFVINLELKNSEHYYKIQFLKTVKDSKRLVKFIKPKKRDIDIVPEVSIVKQVNLTQGKYSKEYYLSDDDDTVYFE